MDIISKTKKIKIKNRITIDHTIYNSETGKTNHNNTDTAITTPRNTKEPNPNTTNNTKESTQGNIIKIFNHINKGGNPLFLKAICNQHNVQMPYTHYHGFKTKISTLIFETQTLAHKFIQSINPNNFGPKAHYQTVPNKKTTDTSQTQKPI